MTEHQADRDTLFMLMQDDLAAFLSDTSDTSAIASMEMEDCAFEPFLLQVRQRLLFVYEDNAKQKKEDIPHSSAPAAAIGSR